LPGSRRMAGAYRSIGVGGWLWLSYSRSLEVSRTTG
jgi:hypothetical protein